MDPQLCYLPFLAGLCVWREARGQSAAAELAVAFSIRNRVLRPGHWNWGTDWISVILKPLQYSSFNANDPNAVKFPTPSDLKWESCCTAARRALTGEGPDPVSGATHYYDKSMDAHPPEWAANMTHVCDIDDLRFFIEREKAAAVAA